MIHHNQKGVTLLEVLLSIVILTIILVTIMNFFPQMGFMNKNNEDKQQAINLAKKELLDWQEVLNSETSLDSFKNSASIGKCQLEDNDMCYIFITEISQETLRDKYDAEIKVWETSELSGSIHANRIQIQIKDDKEHHVISETYGYIFY